MKDLYTFDSTSEAALKTYGEVRAAYADFFDELKMPYLVANADSGDMGGNLSHEYHFATPAGEDNVISCESCDHVTNEELIEGPISDSTKCPRCNAGPLKVQRAVELGHTFHLGTRYSEPLGAVINNHLGERAALEMGCHGIGVSRLIGAVTSILADEKGLNWPRVMAPFEAVIVPAKGLGPDAEHVYDMLSTSSGTGAPVDAVIDDRRHEMGWKFQDADLIGYPVIIVLGRGWKTGRKCEVQCRRLNSLKEEVPEADLVTFVNSLLGRL